MSFKRGQNPYNKLGIGSKAIIDNWFNQWAPDADYEIDNDLNITVNHSLFLYKSNVTWLPNNLIVNGDLNINNTKIIELSDNLTVVGYLNIRFTMIPKLPDNLVVYNEINK